MLKAVEVQAMIGVEDLDTIAYGYIFERYTVDIYFEKGELVRDVFRELPHQKS